MTTTSTHIAVTLTPELTEPAVMRVHHYDDNPPIGAVSIDGGVFTVSSRDAAQLMQLARAFEGAANALWGAQQGVRSA